MINYENVTEENINKHNPNLPQIPDHPYRILLIEGSGSGKTNALFNLIKQREDGDYSIINNIYLYVKDPNVAKYHYLIQIMKKWSSKSGNSKRPLLNIQRK